MTIMKNKKYYCGNLLETSVLVEFFPKKKPMEWFGSDFKYNCLPKVVENMLFASIKQEKKGTILCYEKNINKKIWEFKISDEIGESVTNSSGNFIVTSDYVFVNSSIKEKKCFLLDVTTGLLLSQKTNISISINESVILDKNIFAQVYENKCFLTKIDLPALDYLWKTPLLESSSFGQIYVNESEILTYAGKNIYSFNASNGEQIWKFNVEEIGAHVDFIEKTDKKGKVSAYPLLFDNLIIVPVYGYHLLGLNKETGEQIWKTELKIISLSYAVSIDPEFIHVLGHSNKGVMYYCIDPSDGKILIEKELFDLFKPVSNMSQHTVTKTHIFFTDARKGKIYALNRETWQFDWEYQCKKFTGGYNPPVIMDNKLFQLDSEGNLYVFESESN